MLHQRSLAAKAATAADTIPLLSKIIETKKTMEVLKLSTVILNCLHYENDDELIHQVFVKRNGGKFEPNSETVILKLTDDEVEMKIKDLSESKCPGFDYFLELDILQDMYTEMKESKDYASDEKKIKRIIYYAEFDA